MINDKAILVGVDGSHASYKATWWAANLHEACWTDAADRLRVLAAELRGGVVRRHVYGDGR